MTQPFLDLVQRLAARETQRRRGVSQVVQSDAGKPELLHGSFEALADRVGVQLATVLAGEDASGLEPCLAEELLHLVLPCELPAEYVDRVPVEADEPRTTLGLGWADVTGAADARHLLGDAHDAVVEVDVGPTQSDGLSSPEAGDDDEVPEGSEWIVCGGVEELTDVFRVPDANRRPIRGLELNETRRVVCDQPALDRGIERGPDGCVHPLDRRRGEGTRGFARRRAPRREEGGFHGAAGAGAEHTHGGVDGVDLFGLKASERNVPERGSPVEAKVFLVVLGGAWSDLPPGRKPLVEPLAKRDVAAEAALQVEQPLGLIDGGDRVTALESARDELGEFPPRSTVGALSRVERHSDPPEVSLGLPLTPVAATTDAAPFDAQAELPSAVLGIASELWTRRPEALPRLLVGASTPTADCALHRSRRLPR